MKKLSFVILFLIPLITFGQSQKRYRTVIVNNIEALDDGIIDVKDTLKQDIGIKFNDGTFQSTAAAGGNTLYSGDDDLTGIRVVTMNGNPLIFSGNQTSFDGINAAFGTRVALFEDNVGTNLVEINNNGSVGIGTPGFASTRLTAKSATNTSSSFAFIAQNSDDDFIAAFEGSGKIGFNTIGPYPALSDFTLKDFRRIGFDNSAALSDIAWFRNGSLKVILQANMSSGGEERFDVFVGGPNTVDIGFTVDIDGNIGVGVQNTFGTNAERTLAVINAVAPTSSPADMFQLYSADRGGAGTAAPFFRTEDGDIIKLFADGSYVDPTGTSDKGTFATSTVTTEDLAEFVKAMYEALKATGLLKN